MTRINVQTQNSVYVLDKEKMTWERVVHKASSNRLKEQNGQLAVFPYIEPGLPLLLITFQSAPRTNETKDKSKRHNAVDHDKGLEIGEPVLKKLGFLTTSIVVSSEEEKLEAQA